MTSKAGYFHTMVGTNIAACAATSCLHAEEIWKKSASAAKKKITMYPSRLRRVFVFPKCIISHQGVNVDFFDISFLQDFVSNALATFLGAALGIPIALWINRHQERSSEKERKKKILSLLAEELIINLTQLSGWQKNKRKKIETTIMGPMLRDESWRAFSDGGELEWIKNPTLVSELANAYSYIRTLQQLTERYTNLVFLSKENENTIAVNELWKTIEKGISEIMYIVEDAIKGIGKERET